MCPVCAAPKGGLFALLQHSTLFISMPPPSLPAYRQQITWSFVVKRFIWAYCSFVRDCSVWRNRQLRRSFPAGSDFIRISDHVLFFSTSRQCSLSLELLSFTLFFGFTQQLSQLLPQCLQDHSSFAVETWWRRNFIEVRLETTWINELTPLGVENSLAV